MLTEEEEKALGIEIKKGNKEALKKLVESNLRFVVHVANRLKNPSISLLDLILEGNLGLIEAAKRYDPERNNRFISYAYWYIKEAMIEALSQTAPVYIPLKRAFQLYTLSRVTNGLRHVLNRNPTVEEIADEMGISVEEVMTLQAYDAEKVSANAPLAKFEGLTVEDLLMADKEHAPDVPLLKEAFEKELKELLASLSERERQILTLRYGLEGEPPLTLQTIAKRMGMSKERVRQLERRALIKLRKLKGSRNLLSYLA